MGVWASLWNWPKCTNFANFPLPSQLSSGIVLPNPGAVANRVLKFYLSTISYKIVVPLNISYHLLLVSPLFVSNISGKFNWKNDSLPLNKVFIKFSLNFLDNNIILNFIEKVICIRRLWRLHLFHNNGINFRDSSLLAYFWGRNTYLNK